MHRHNHFRENPMMDFTSVDKIYSKDASWYPDGLDIFL